MLKKIVRIWHMLNRPIYAGKRLEENLFALSAAGVLSAALGLDLMVLYIVRRQMGMVGATAVIFLLGVLCVFSAHVLKRRDLAVLMPTLFCAVGFTAYTLTGAGKGYATLWTMLVPIGISYFVSVKYGLLLSAYYTILFFLAFYSPLRGVIHVWYPEEYALRFPLVFATMSALTGIAMIQYHRGVLLENDYADRLNFEVKRQTQFATERADRLEALSAEMVETLAVTIDAKDKYTNGHSFRVSWYSIALARALGWEESEIKALEQEALLHDIGKIGVPDSVLNKPGRLTDEEFKIIQSHTRVGGSILSRSENLLKAAEVARHHHERYDGSGYPDRLSGEAIPVHARIVAIADAYDAMHSDRVYRKGLSREVTRNELVKGRGRQFDPVFLDAFLKLLDTGALDEINEREIASYDDQDASDAPAIA